MPTTRQTKDDPETPYGAMPTNGTAGESADVPPTVRQPAQPLHLYSESQQLLGGLYSESQQLLSTVDPSIILIASELIEVEHDGEVITVRICLKSLCECDATVKTTILSSLYCALHGVPGDIEWFPTGVIAAWNGCLSTHLNGGCRQRQDFH